MLLDGSNTFVPERRKITVDGFLKLLEMVEPYDWKLYKQIKT